MAGDWIKIEKATARKPEVLRVAEILDIHPDQALGLCVRFWCWCDDHVSRSCHAVVTSLSSLSRAMDCPGFAEAMVEVGWLEASDDGIVIPHVDYHLSQSAKTRALANNRKRKERSRESHADTVTKAGPEKRREEIEERERKSAGAGGHEIPTLTESRQWAKAERIAKATVDGWHANREAQGWVRGNGIPIANWRADLRAWAHEDARRAQAPRPTGGRNERPSPPPSKPLELE